MPALLAGVKWHVPTVADQIAGLSPIVFVLVILLIIVLIVWLVRRV